MAEVWLNTQEDRLTPAGDRTRLHTYGQSEGISFGEFNGEVWVKRAACSQSITNRLRKEFVTLDNQLQSLA